ncbi:hypothetical protein CFB89_13570 [Burkholderia sp. AU16741]|nr:hypothetical protein CFB89_13570 [Burkholderia sp. AU16741]
MLHAKFARTRKKNQSDKFEFCTANCYKHRSTANGPTAARFHRAVILNIVFNGVKGEKDARCEIRRAGHDFDGRAADVHH